MAWPKTSRHARGYGTEWDKLRLVVLERDGWACQCPECLRRPPGWTATEVDHIRSKADGGDDSLENLRAVNSACHRRLTTLGKGHKPRIEVGVDGWPRDLPGWSRGGVNS